MLTYFLIVAIAYGIAYGITSTGLHLWRAIAGFALAFVVAWFGGSALGTFLITWMKWGDANSLLPIIGQGFWWALLGAGVGVYRARYKLRTGETAPPISIPKWVAITTLGLFLIGILAAVALPAYQDYTKRSYSSSYSKEKETSSVASKSTTAEFESFSGTLDKEIHNTPTIVQNRPNNQAPISDKEILRRQGIGGNQSLADVSLWGNAQLSARFFDESELRKAENFVLMWQRQIIHKLQISPERALFLGYSIVTGYVDNDKAICRPDIKKNGGIEDLPGDSFETYPECFAKQ